MGISVGGTDGEFYMNGDVVDYARRLPGIARTANVFGVHIEGTSMQPKYEPGELVYASPGRAPVAGDYIIVELVPTDGERAGPAYVKRLVRRSGTRLICEQFNPAGEVEYDQREVKAVYRIIPMSELVGF
ncbi:S24 family peptidase [Terrihabitans sp. B22-R8]|uniref:S24 family peptidase n=1 Tax=Terrihabitans sp. B22-R8 TaxID=3425128 RepID=UPI00403C559C